MKNQLEQKIKTALEKLNISYEEPILIEVPKDKQNGDFATNIAMQLARVEKKNPRELAQSIVESIDSNAIQKMEIAGPGFINFFVEKTYLLENINQVLKEKENYGRSTIGQKEKVNIEFVSANPTGILHLGHARGAAFGDSLAKIMDFAGYDVTREYYINDGGNQMNNLGKSIKARYENLCGIQTEFPEDGYHGKEIITIAEKLYNEQKDGVLQEEIPFFRVYGLHILLEQIKKDLKNFNVEFDVWTSEEALYQSGKVQQAYQKLMQDGKTYEQDGAIFLKTTDYNDEKDRVLVKQDGNNTYLLPDIAYHRDKYDRGFDQLIDILGADHHGYIARLKASIAMMGYDPEKLDVQILQMVRVIQNGQELKMSKRTGNAITISELVEEVGVDAARYFFVSHSLDSQMDFDMDLAVKKSNENPIYYINYAHARICAILRDANKIDYMNQIQYNTITSDAAYNVLTKVYEWTEVVEKAAKRREVHPITNYAYELASLFHTYYAQEKIMTDDRKYTQEHLALIKAVQIVLQNALRLIGVNAYEKM